MAFTQMEIFESIDSKIVTTLSYKYVSVNKKCLNIQKRKDERKLKKIFMKNIITHNTMATLNKDSRQ